MKKVVGRAVKFQGLQQNSEHIIELAQEMGSRAHELSKDEAKGHKARKKKAFVEFRKGLDALGVSKHTSSVPEQERGCVHEWLAYTELNSQQLQVFKLSTILPIFQDAHSLHFKSISALQRLWQVGEQCHDDVRSEISNIKNRCEHLLYIQRCQRKGLSLFLNVFQELVDFKNQLPKIDDQIVREQKKCQEEIEKYAENLPKLELDCLYAKTEIQNLRFIESISSEFDKQIKSGDSAVQQLYSSLKQKVKLFSDMYSKLSSVQKCGLVSKQERDELHTQLNTLKEQIKDQFELLKFTQQQYEDIPMEFQLCVMSDSQQLPDLPVYLPALKNLQKQLDLLFSESQKQQIKNQSANQNSMCELGGDLEDVIKDTLLWAQNLSSVLENINFDEQQITLGDATLMFVKLLGQGPIQKLTEKLKNGLQKLGNCLDSCSLDDRELAYLNSYLIQIKTLIELVSAACEGIVQQFLVFQRATCKLGFVVISICVSLMCDGFCGPAEEAAGEGEGDGDIFKEEEGMGLGEGQGAKDVSDQIEDEDQIQGAKQKDQQQEDEMQQDLEAGEDKGIEMDEDFAGQMCDIPKEEQDKKEDDGDDLDEEEERLDQQLGDVGDEGDVVDEKLWADDKDEEDEQNQENKKPQDTYEKDAPIQVEDKSNLEYHAGQEEEDTDQKVGDTKPESRDVQDEMKEDEQGLGEDEEGAVNEEIIEEKQFAKPEAPDEEFELDDQMNLDDVEEEEQGDGEGQGEGEGDQMDAEERKEFPQEQQNDQDQDQLLDEQEQQQNDDETNDNEETKASDPVQKVEEDNEQPQPGEEPQLEEKDIQDNYQNQNEYESTPEIGPRGQASNQLNLPQPIEQKLDGQGDDESAEEEEEEMDVDQGENVQAVEGMDMGENNPGDAVGQNANTKRLTQWNPQIASQENTNKKQKKSSQMPEVNPSRSLADAIEKWKENLAMKHDVGNTQRQQQQQSNEEDDEDTQTNDQIAEEYQFLQDDDVKQKTDTQTIASATKEQAQQQLQGDQNSKEEDDVEGYDSDAVMAGHSESESSGEEMDDGEEEEELEMANTIQGKDSKNKFCKGSTGKTDIQADKPNSNSEQDDQSDSDIEMDNSENEDDESPQENDAAQNAIHSYISYKSGVQDTDTDSQLQNQIQSLTMPEERREELRKQIEMYIQNPEQAADLEVQKGREIWGRCDALTAGLAGELAEQLRLVLEPQMASRLVGDYKSGKRINMKKVIQFIASRFRKDKIWMRRTKPNKRTYQVVLAVDDSRSMTESGCAPYALEALTLICKAMQRLEVGQLGLVSFGGSKGVQLLHSLEQPFSDSLGPSVLGRLGFDQDSTLDKRPMAELMVSLQHLLQQAKQNRSQSRSSVPLHQLVLIIADGRLHERDNLKKMVRETCDVEGAVFVYIVVDNPKDSVLDIKQVKFLANGGITTDPYLDSFPFPYYILLRQISALPRTLAELLQQFFQHAMAQQ